MTWDELLRKPDKSEIETTLVQCICSLSVEPTYEEMTPGEIYDLQVEKAQQGFAGDWGGDAE